MAVSSFVPEVWGAAVLTALDEALAYGSAGVTNRDYEGEVSEYGGSVTINTAADPAIETYVPYAAMTGGQAATTSQVMNLDQRKAFSFDLDDVERAQSRDDGDLVGKLSARAAHKLGATADAYIAGLMAAAVTPGTEVTPATPADAYDLLVDLRTELSENDVPTDGRWAVVTPAFYALLLKDSRFTATGDAQAGLTRSNGVVGQAAGFTVLESNQAPAGPGEGAGRLIIAGHALATTYADQVTKTEAVRLPDRFVDRVRGLHVYGAKVVRPEALAARDVIVGA
ncbi:P22 phage major capsid protein family protein [Streptomyces albidoflavus]|uniref:P22 phage major capsid protein family protein n=1 Tax=Streptomyces albidoflavus TaxID=1886 RepID=UPI002E3478E6|nr:P22 phage major capsid protein family protein [Streptomyces albidoflavus]